MNYEKAYNEALERARQVYTTNVDENKKSTEYIFPELVENNDEKIRKEIISLVKYFYGSSLYHIETVSKDNMIAWLEKQSEQKSIPNDEPKTEDEGLTDFEKSVKHIMEEAIEEGNTHNFKADADMLLRLVQKSLIKQKFNVGDWIIFNGLTYRVDKIVQGYYRIRPLDGFNSSSNIDDTARLWTLKDARDGDVLVDNKRPFIFKGFLDSQHPNHPVAYCGIGTSGSFICSNGHCWWTNNKDDIKPAIKEERELLFQEMGKAGYVWNGNTKELKKK